MDRRDPSVTLSLNLLRIRSRHVNHDISWCEFCKHKNSSTEGLHFFFSYTTHSHFNVEVFEIKHVIRYARNLLVNDNHHYLDYLIIASLCFWIPVLSPLLSVKPQCCKLPGNQGTINSTRRGGEGRLDARQSTRKRGVAPFLSICIRNDMFFVLPHLFRLR